MLSSFVLLNVSEIIIKEKKVTEITFEAVEIGGKSISLDLIHESILKMHTFGICKI